MMVTIYTPERLASYQRSLTFTRQWEITRTANFVSWETGAVYSKFWPEEVEMDRV